MRLPTGEKIEGLWNNNALTSTAIFTEANGDRFEEFYKDGLPEGARKPLKRKGHQMEALLQAPVPPAWKEDRESNNCFACNSPFTMIKRVSSR